MTTWGSDGQPRDSLGRRITLTKTARNRRVHFSRNLTEPNLCGSRNRRDWHTRFEANVNCPRCQRLLAPQGGESTTGHGAPDPKTPSTEEAGT